MFNNEKDLQLYSPKQPSLPLLQWLEQQIVQISPSSKKRPNLQVVINDLYCQPFLAKFLLKANYRFFSNTQLIDLIDGIVLRKMSFDDRKYKFLTLIEKYLQNYQRKKFTQHYRQCLFKQLIKKEQDKSSHQVIRLLLFIAIKSENKNQFIENIFKMPVDYQQNLKDQVMEVESLLENITQKQQLTLQFSSLKELNIEMKQNYEELVDYQNQLLDQCENYDISKSVLEQKVHENKNEKMNICQLIRIQDPQKPYLKIYKYLNQKNDSLTRILAQKQKKQNQLNEEHLSLKQKLDEFEQVLYQLTDQKKILKVVLNDKKNQTFNLEMRASLRFSQDNEKLRIGEALKRKSVTHIHSSFKNGTCLDGWENFKLKKQQHQLPQFNQSLNILSKIQELRSQKESLTKQLSHLKMQNKKLAKKDNLNKRTFKQLTEIYSEFLSLNLPVNEKNILKKEKSPQILNKKTEEKLPLNEKKTIQIQNSPVSLNERNRSNIVLNERNVLEIENSPPVLNVKKRSGRNEKFQISLRRVNSRYQQVENLECF